MPIKEFQDFFAKNKDFYLQVVEGIINSLKKDVGDHGTVQVKDNSPNYKIIVKIGKQQRTLYATFEEWAAGLFYPNLISIVQEIKDLTNSN